MKLPSLFVCGALLLQSTVGLAHDETGSVVSGTGTVIVHQVPTTMRMTIQFKETAKDLTTALKNLKDRRDAAKSQLVKFGAQESSIREGDPALGGEDPRAMMMMVARQGGKKKKKEAAAKVTVTANLSCEWALPAGGMDATLLFVQTTKEKVQGANLAGQSDAKKVSAEEQEELEEMEMMQQQYGNPQEAKPGEPRYVFLAKISAEEQQKARAAAFKKAQHQAEQLAAAAGMKLGKLHSLNATGGNNYEMQMMAYSRYGMDDDSQVSDPADDPNDEETGKSMKCSKVKFGFTVVANFDIKE